MSVLIGDTSANDYFKLYFNNTAIALIGDAAGLQPSAVPGNLYIALHTAPVVVGNVQTTNEAAYTGYLRVAVARTAGGWTITGRRVNNAATIAFPDSAGNNQTIVALSVGVAGSGAGKIIWAIDLTTSITTVTGPLPVIPAGFIEISL